jgi:hypothetical protein
MRFQGRMHAIRLGALFHKSSTRPSPPRAKTTGIVSVETSSIGASPSEDPTNLQAITLGTVLAGYNPRFQSRKRRCAITCARMHALSYALPYTRGGTSQNWVQGGTVSRNNTLLTATLPSSDVYFGSLFAHWLPRPEVCFLGHVVHEVHLLEGRGATCAPSSSQLMTALV